MSTGLSGIKDLPYFLLGSALLLGTMLLLNKGCAHLAGSYERQELQVKQLEALRIPENTELIKKFESTPDYSHVWITYSYQTTLPSQRVYEYYKKQASANQWVCYKNCNTEIYSGEDTVFWYKQDHTLRLYYYTDTNLEEYNFSIMIEWNKYKGEI
jgi:hypothetical protein